MSLYRDSDSDIEWVRAQLASEPFHREYSQRWLAVREKRVVFKDPKKATLMAWLEENDPDRLCVIAFADDRKLA